MEKEAWENSMMFKVQQACIAGLRRIQNIDIGWDSEPDRDALKNPLRNYINFANRKGLSNKIRNPLNSGGGTVWKDRN
jgi:elongation factor P hydroxylase